MSAGKFEKKPGEEPEAFQSGAEPGATSGGFQPLVQKPHKVSIGVLGTLAGQCNELSAAEFKSATENGRSVIFEENGATTSQGTKKPDL